MEVLIAWLSSHAWVGVAISIALAVHTFLKALTDAMVSLRAEIDKTPDKDDNLFEKAVTKMKLLMVLLNKIALYLVGIRQKK